MVSFGGGLGERGVRMPHLCPEESPEIHALREEKARTPRPASGSARHSSTSDRRRLECVSEVLYSRCS